MVIQLNKIDVVKLNLDPQTGGIDGIRLEVKFGSPKTEATILMRHPRPIPNTPDSIREAIVRLSEALVELGTSIQE